MPNSDLARKLTGADTNSKIKVGNLSCPYPTFKGRSQESMPLYEYECKKCHHRFERIMKYSDRPVKKCPDCGGPVEQTITAPAVQFKGSGWYVTDYAKKPAGTAPSSNGDSKSKDEASSKKESGSKEVSKKEEKPSKPTEKSKPDSSSKKAEKK